MRKSDRVIQAVEEGDYKAALRIAKDFHINVSENDRRSMELAYECMVHPEFYRQLGTDTGKAIEAGEETVTRLYGRKERQNG